MQLRNYQSTALHASKKAFDEGVTRQIVQLPTGMGKTPLLASVPKYFGFQRRSLVLVHREELALQAVDKIKRWNPGSTVGIEMADKWASAGDQFVVGSVQTLASSLSRGSERAKRFDKTEFDAIICDEAHHAAAPSYVKVFEHFGLSDRDTKRLFLGVTATPNRGDGIPLATVFDRIVYQYSIRDGIRDGWLSDMRGYKVRGNVNLDQVHTVAGDFAQDELANAVNNPQRNGVIVKAWIENAFPRRTIAFCVDIKHAKDLAHTFQVAGVPAEAIWGNDPDRESKLARHKRGEITVLTNCNILTEGYDDWQVACVILAKPTKSQLLFVQMAGRGTRIQEGIDNQVAALNRGEQLQKSDCLLMDVVDSTSKHSLITLPSLFGMNAEMDLQGKSAYKAITKIEELEELHPNVDFSRVIDINSLKTHVEQVDLFNLHVPEIVEKNSELRWHQNFDGSFSLLLPKTHERITVTQDMLGKYRLDGTIQGEQFHEDGFDEFGDAVRYAEMKLSTYGQHFIAMLRREWQTGGAPVTDNQWGLLTKFFGKRRPQEFAELERMKATGELTKQKASHIISNALNGKQQMRAGR